MKIKSIKRKKYKGKIYDVTLTNDKNPYFFANDILSHNSLYPHIMIQCNLYGRKHEGVINDRPIWYGDNKWKVDGTYYSDELAKVGELLKQWYADRLLYKSKNDRREYTIKIIINTVYGLLCNSFYKKVFDIVGGADCTRLGRQWTKYARKIFRDSGYKILATDTDSVYLLDPFKDKEKMLEVKKKIINDIKSTVPFPENTFDMGIDDEIKYMFFFKGGSKTTTKYDDDEEMDEDDFINRSKGFMKKNYIYVTKDNELKIKNLGINKKSISPLSKKIFWEHLAPKIIETGECKFSKTYIKNLIYNLLQEDIKLACMRKNVGDISQYKKSPNSLQAQISQKYGAGIYFLVPNVKGIGVGKGLKYCTLEEFKERNCKIDDIDFKNIWSELDYFIKPVVTKTIFDF